MITQGRNCDSPNRFEHYTSCQSAGVCVKSMQDDGRNGRFLPQSTSDIDTNAPFHFKIDFESEQCIYTVTTTQEKLDDQNQTITTSITFDRDDACSGDLSKLKWVLGDGMAIILNNTNGGEYANMTWLNGNQECNKSCVGSLAVIANLSIHYANNTVPEMPSVYQFGSECTQSTHGECGYPKKCDTTGE